MSNGEAGFQDVPHLFDITERCALMDTEVLSEGEHKSVKAVFVHVF
jgi:hypothetical protein